MKEIRETIENAISNPYLMDRDKAIRFLEAINDTEERINIAIRLLIKLFGTDDYEINYIIGILNGQREVWTSDKLKELQGDKK